MHVNKVHHVTTINRVAKDLGEDEDWLSDVANEMDIEDGVIWVYGVGEDGVMVRTIVWHQLPNQGFGAFGVISFRHSACRFWRSRSPAEKRDEIAPSHDWPPELTGRGGELPMRNRSMTSLFKHISTAPAAMPPLRWPRSQNLTSMPRSGGSGAGLSCHAGGAAGRTSCDDGEAPAYLALCQRVSPANRHRTCSRWQRRSRLLRSKRRSSCPRLRPYRLASLRHRVICCQGTCLVRSRAWMIAKLMRCLLQ